MVHVSWTDAVAFCHWLSQRQGEKGPVVRLPTEAEWELAARGEKGRKYPWGSSEPTDELANYGRSVGDTTPVGSYPDGATPQGVLDLAGTVWEWCGDYNGRYPVEDESDPTGPRMGLSRVLRGGSFLVIPRSLRAACRRGDNPELRNDFVGFRVLSSSSGGLGP